MFRFSCGCAEITPIPGELAGRLLTSGEHDCPRHGPVRLTVVVNAPLGVQPEDPR
jgi:hypothetical protein